MTTAQLAELIEKTAERHALGPRGDRTHEVGVSYTRICDYKAGAKAWLEIGRLLGFAEGYTDAAYDYCELPKRGDLAPGEMRYRKAVAAIAKLTEERK